MQISSPENNQFIHRLSGGIVALTIAFIVGIIFFVSALPAQAATTIIYVDASAGGANNGTSWVDAYTNLQAALANGAIPPDMGDDVQIWVAAGTYPPGAARLDTFQLVNSVAIYGGFAGGETLLSERDPATNGTVLSGDLNGDDTANFGNRGDNSYHVVVGSGTDATAVLDGFTIRGGSADTVSAPDNNGGGIYNDSGSPTLQNLIIDDNQARNGGGIYNRNSSSPTLTNVTISGNKIIQFGNAGGGMNNYNDSSPTLTNVIISGNQALTDGGGIFNGEDSNPILTNVAIVGNVVSAGGAGLHNERSDPTLTNVTISGNRFTLGFGLNAGGIINEESNVLIQNSVIWGNNTQVGGISSVVTYTNSLVQGQDLTGEGIGNLDGTTATPDFVAPEAAGSAPTTAGDYRLQNTSDVIDAGDNSLNSEPTDLDGNSRIQNGTIDLGAYEFSVTPTPVSASVDFRFWNWLVWLGLVAFAAWGFRRRKTA